jgi:hypothetical protein
MMLVPVKKRQGERGREQGRLKQWCLYPKEVFYMKKLPQLIFYFL